LFLLLARDNPYEPIQVWLICPPVRVDLPRPNVVPLIVRLCYLVDRLIPVRDPSSRLGWMLDLEWSVARLCHEHSIRVFPPERHPHYSQALNFLSKHLEPSHRVLDVGCNTGVMTAEIAKLVREVIGVDYSDEAILTARETHRAENLSFEACDAIKYSTGLNERFDVVVLSHIVEHLDDPVDLLAPLSRCCRFVYFEVPDFEHNVLNHHRESLQRGLIYTDVDHRFELDRKDAVTLLERCSLQVLESEFLFGSQRYWCKSV
jgi:SAM-dependent methyltransferase